MKTLTIKMLTKDEAHEAMNRATDTGRNATARPSRHWAKACARVQAKVRPGNGKPVHGALYYVDVVELALVIAGLFAAVVVIGS